jgi:hypothetical protein
MKSYDFGSKINPRPLVNERAVIGAGNPYVLDVTNGQWEGDPRLKTLVVKAQVAPGVPLERAKAVFQLAAIDTFGETVPAPRLLDWYNPALEKVPVSPLVLLTLIFFPGIIHYGPDKKVSRVEPLTDAQVFIATRRPSTIRDVMAYNMRLRHEETKG